MKKTIVTSIIALLLLASCATKAEGVSLGTLQSADAASSDISNVQNDVDVPENTAIETEPDIVFDEGINTDKGDDSTSPSVDYTEKKASNPDGGQNVMQPIVRHYTYEGYDFSLSAYPGRLYLVHPEELGSYEIDLLASYLMQRHPQQLKDVTYSESNGVLTLTYPESWTVAELDYAQSVLMDELAKLSKGNGEDAIEAPTEQAIQETAKETAEDVVGDTLGDGLGRKAIDDGVETFGSSFEDAPVVLASEDEWWNDPIFEGSYDPTAEIGSMQTEGHSEIQESEGTIDLEAFDWTVDDVPEELEGNVLIEAFEAIESKENQDDGSAEEQEKESFVEKAKAVLSKAKDSAMRFKDSATKALKGMSFEDMVFVGLVVLFAIGLLVVLMVVRSKRRRSDKESEDGSFDA